mmetsp:Transcript_95952/g.304641  ORF Transcript_95952/g.304641 Transcript_95952/m.304641 type:complete len:432 (+) Transcript_95952:1079-2374(+)
MGGHAVRAEERYLVYELLPGGDVCARLRRDPTFTWRPRLSVALDAALGLSHLHGSRPQVFHRDIKTQNILMDRNGTGKMADFGLARLAKQDSLSLTVENASGTLGYADPAYIRTGRVTEASEVYSFGMVLLEILTRRPPALQHADSRIEYQFAHVKGNLQRVLEMLDSRGQWPESVASLVGTLALQCVDEDEALRPPFTGIVGDLRRWLREYAADMSPAVPTLGAGASYAAAGWPGAGVPKGWEAPPVAAGADTARSRETLTTNVFAGTVNGVAQDPAAAGSGQAPLERAGWATSHSSSSRGPEQRAPGSGQSGAERTPGKGSPQAEWRPDGGRQRGVEADLDPGPEEAHGLAGSSAVDSSPRACVDCGRGPASEDAAPGASEDAAPDLWLSSWAATRCARRSATWSTSCSPVATSARDCGGTPPSPGGRA